MAPKPSSAAIRIVSLGKICFSSHSAAKGVMASAVNFRAMSWIWSWSSVRSNWCDMASALAPARRELPVGSGAAFVGEAALRVGALQRVTGPGEGHDLRPTLAFAGEVEQAGEADRDGGSPSLQSRGRFVEANAGVADRDQALVLAARRGAVGGHHAPASLILRRNDVARDRGCDFGRLLVGHGCRRIVYDIIVNGVRSRVRLRDDLVEAVGILRFFVDGLIAATGWHAENERQWNRCKDAFHDGHNDRHAKLVS